MRFLKKTVWLGIRSNKHPKVFFRWPSYFVVKLRSFRPTVEEEQIRLVGGVRLGHSKVSFEWVNGNGSKEMGRIGLLCHGSNLNRFGIGSNGLGSTLKNAKFKGDNILISTQVHSTQFDLSQFDLSYSTKRVDLILFDLFHSTHFMQSDEPIRKGLHEMGRMK